MSFKNIGKILEAGTDTSKLVTASKELKSIYRAAKALELTSLDKSTKISVLSEAFQLKGDEIENLVTVTEGLNDVGKASARVKKKIEDLKATGKGITNSLSSSLKQTFSIVTNFFTAHPILLAATALAAAFAIVSKVTTDAKEKVDKAVSSSEKYEQTKSDIQSIESELETVGNQIDELNAKDHLSFTDQAELSNLQAQSAELERQLELKQTLANIQQDKAARDAKDAFNAHSMRDTVNDNEGGFFNTIKTTYQKAYAWVHDKLGMSESNQDILFGVPFSDTIGLKTADGTILDRIQQAQKAVDDLKDLQKSQAAYNYDEVQKDIEDQQKVVDNYRDNIQELYSTMESYATSFYNQDTGNILPGYEDEAKRWEEVQKEYLDFFTSNSGKSIDQSIEGVLSKVKFDGIKDTLVKAGEEGSDAFDKALSEGNYSGLKTSDEYGKVGNQKYQASVDFLVPDTINHSDQKAVQKYLDSIRKYMTFDKDGNVNGVNMDKFFSNAVKKGLMIDDGENYQLAGEMTMKDFVLTSGTGYFRRNP